MNYMHPYFVPIAGIQTASTSNNKTKTLETRSAMESRSAYFLTHMWHTQSSCLFSRLK